MLNAIAERAYAAFAARRARISVALGLAACGVRGSVPAAFGPNEQRPVRRAWLGAARELVVAYVIVVAALQALDENQFARRFLRFRQPLWARQSATYLQLFQGWAMFAPDAPMTDMNVFVVARTADGREIDPFNQQSNPAHPAPGAAVPAHLDQNSFFCDYLTRIEHQGAYHQAFIEWILRHPERTGRPEDRVVSFEAFVVEDDSPPPGETEPRRARVRSFLKYEPQR